MNGGVIKVRDGRTLMDSIASHHYLLLVGHFLPDIRMIAQVFDMDVQAI